MTDEKTQQLENRIDKLESTIEKMMPSRRDALKMGGAALVGGAAMSGTASAGTNQVGTIGSQASPVDLESEDINNADTITTQDIVVNGTATGPFGGGAAFLESGDNFTQVDIANNSTDQSFVTLYNDIERDLVSGQINGAFNHNFLYTFSDSSTIKYQGTGTTYSIGGNSPGADRAGGTFDVTALPPAKGIVKIEIGARILGSSNFGAQAILKD